MREIKEELDTEIKVGDLIDTIEYDYPNFHLSMDCFWCEIVSGDLVLKEHEAAKWLKKAELDSVEWLPADITLIESSLAFGAEICRYMKKSNGKRIDYDLKNPVDIHKVKGYKVPTDEELVDQQIDRLVCETCRYYDHCFMGNCIANEAERKKRKETLKSLEPGKFTPFTVMLAYELEYRMMMQMGGFTYEESDKNAPIVRKIIEICEAHPVYYVGDVKEALARMLYPDKARVYIGEK